MVKIRVKVNCKYCGNDEIMEAERDVDGALAGDIHCGQCGNIVEGDVSVVQLISPDGNSS
jgi:transcription elongation factor Elf1